MLRIRTLLLLALPIVVVFGFYLTAAGEGKPVTNVSTLNPDPTPNPDWDLKAEMSGEEDDADHVESYVPLVGEESEPSGPTHEELEQERLTAKTNPYQSDSKDLLGPKASILWEDFEGGVVPPAGWTAVVNNAFTWEIDDYDPFEGSYYASCFYDSFYTGTQDEWIVSPLLDLSTSTTDLKLTFAWMGSYYWAVDPYDNYDLEVWISTDGGANFSTRLWYEHDYGEFTSWLWNQTTLDLSAYAGESSVKIGFRYYGYDGAQFSVDAIDLNDDPPPVGRCCYGDPLTPSCDDVNYAACEATGTMQSWSEGLNCTDNPCPPSGYGDVCANPIVVTLPADMPYNDLSQYTCGRGNDYSEDDMCYGYGYGGGEDIVYRLDVTETVNIQMTIDPKGTTWTYCEIRNDCPPTGGSSGDCVYYFRNTGSDEYVSDAVELAPGTYYMLIDTWPTPDCIPDFDLTIDAWAPPTGRCCYGDPQAPSCDDIDYESCEALGTMISWDEGLNCTDDPCPTASEGDNCAWPIDVKLPGDMPYSDLNQYTCGRGNHYDATCLGSYDGGEDIIYWLDVSEACDVDIMLDPKGTTYTGILIDNVCPAGDPCIAFHKNSGSDPHGITGLHLEPGSYYVMVDTWPSPDCIPDFDLTITAADLGDPGDNCLNPLSVKLPDDYGVVFTDSTCGRGNNADATCLYSYDNGEDIFYLIDVSTAIDVDITLDPKGTDHPGMVISAGCPATSSDCIVKATTSGTGPLMIENLHLEAGLYYLQIDSYEYYVSCLPEFDLTFAQAAGGPENDDWDKALAIGYETDLEFSTNAASFDGPGGCQTAPNVWYCFTATEDAVVTATLCGSGYDTKMALYDGCGDPASSTELDCNDDSPCDKARALQSTITFSAVTGSSYLIEVGGYSSNTGTGILNVFPAPVFDCPEEASAEGETCGDDTNGGCNSVPPIFGSIACDETVCGEIFADGGTRDTDWYTLVLTSNYNQVTLTASAEFPLVIGFVETVPLGIDDCAYSTGYLEPYAVADAMDTVTLEATLPAGNYWVFVSHQDFYDFPCSADPWEYFIGVECVGMTGPDLTYDPEEIIFAGVNPGDAGSTTLTLGNAGDMDLEFTLEVQYNGGKEIDGASITTPDAYTPGSTADITFMLGNDSQDAEWLDAATITFTSGVTVNSATDFVVPSNPAHYLTYNGETGEAVTSTWYDAGGGYGNIWSTETAEATVNLTFDETLEGDLTFAYTISGDDWGDPPHDVSGTVVLPQADPTTSWLTLAPTSGTIAPAGNEPVTVSYSSTGLENGTYTANIVISSNGKADVLVPVTLIVGGGNEITLIEPDPIHFLMQYAVEDSVIGYAYLGGDFAGGGNAVEDINSSGLLINGSIVPDAVEVIPGHPDFTGTVLKLTFYVAEFIVTYPLLWGVDTYTYNVSGEFNGGSPFTQDGSVVMIGFMPGDVTFDGVVNILDISYTVNYIYKNGPQPEPIIETADTDGNGMINILDISRTVNYLYKNGPELTHP
ncbi:MAG: dockerin type I repeat-containing protein [Candidatus Zixiibacteriota bacterium]|nr:MAG: dockerin type I repeat-containing protein [candidate division Zixibacteria bacterium]